VFGPNPAPAFWFYSAARRIAIIRPAKNQTEAAVSNKPDKASEAAIPSPLALNTTQLRKS